MASFVLPSPLLQFQASSFISSNFKHIHPHIIFKDPGRIHFSAGNNCRCFGSSTRATRNSSVFESDSPEFNDELGFKEQPNNHLNLERSLNDRESLDTDSSVQNGPNSSGFEFLQGDEKQNVEESLREEDLVRVDSKKLGVRKSKQMMKRSSIVAKQVITVQSALSMGFVSQLWVDTTSWVVLVVEVRPNLLSGEAEKFLLEDISQVGDVVLVEDENVMEIDFKMVGLETLVGYRVVTPEQRNIGKVRGYTFNINSGAIESLELDSFGISIIPSSLVSTYGLLVEDILDVVSDTVVVDEAAAARIQKLTKGLWDAKSNGASLNEYLDTGEPDSFDHPLRRRKRSSSRKSNSKTRDTEDDWSVPLDYL